MPPHWAYHPIYTRPIESCGFCWFVPHLSDGLLTIAATSRTSG